MKKKLVILPEPEPSMSIQHKSVSPSYRIMAKNLSGRGTRERKSFWLLSERTSGHSVWPKGRVSGARGVTESLFLTNQPPQPPKPPTSPHPRRPK